MFNQRYRAYLKATGIDPSKVRGYQYMAWLEDMWDQFVEEKGIKTDFNLDGKYAGEFDNWLEKRVQSINNRTSYTDKKGKEIFVSHGLGRGIWQKEERRTESISQNPFHKRRKKEEGNGCQTNINLTEK